MTSCIAHFLEKRGSDNNIEGEESFIFLTIIFDSDDVSLLPSPLVSSPPQNIPAYLS